MSKLEELNLSARTVKALETAEITTVEQLNALDATALKAIKGLGPKSQEEVLNAISAESAPEAATEEKADFAKAGKRSKKAADEAEVEAEKEARKERIATGEEEEVAEKRGPVPVTRSKLERRAKKYRKAHELIKEDSYELKDAIALAIETSVTSFDSTVEMHINLNVNPAHADQNIRSTLVLPNGTGKEVRVAVFTTEDRIQEAKKAGADIAGADDFIDKLTKEELDFDLLIATPNVMAQLGKFARVLGPKGLMPNPKSGTVTTNIETAVKEAKAGKIEYRVDSKGIVHVGIGKASFGTDSIVENAKTLLESISSNKPASVKGALIEKVSVSSTMGPGIRVKL
jgi:large subunit ribosomal protein L1